MAGGGFGYSFKDGDWARVRQIIQQLASVKLGPNSTPTFGGATFNGTLDMNDNPITNVDYIDFDLVNGVSPAEGRLVWNDDEGTLNIGMPGGNVNLQVGQEILTRARNQTGSTILNGTPVYIAGGSGAFVLVAPADADYDLGLGFRTFGVATEDIGHNANGYVAIHGVVRGVDMSMYAAGQPLYLAVGGGYATSPPAAPDVRVVMGVVRQAIVDGEFFVLLTTVPNLNNLSDTNGTPTIDLQSWKWDVTDSKFKLYDETDDQTLLDSFNGIFLESFDFRITEAGGTVTGSLEQTNTGDLTQRFSDGYTTLDCTPAATIDLTAYVGTDAAPKEFKVYILQSGKTTLVATNGDWPATEHCKVCNGVLRSAVTTGTDGALGNRNWNDHAQGTNNQGHLTHIEERIRQLGAAWKNGVAMTLKNAAGAELTTTNSSTAVELVTTVGSVYQMHTQVFPATDMYTTATDDAHIVNDSVSPYQTTTDLVTDITAEADGTAITVNRYFNLVIWGVANKTDEKSHVMINLPTGQYTGESNAVADVDATSVFNMPDAFKGVGFLIARLTFRLIAGSQWTYIAQEDLRGQTPGASAGVGLTTTDHSLLANLIAPADDHTQYLKTDGTRTVAGNLTVDGSAYLKEAAAAGSDVTAYGQVWAKSDAPSTLWHTDDTGVDYRLASFLTAGDPSSFDYSLGDLTTDFTWNDLDLSSLAPAGAKAVLINVRIKDDVLGSQISFRQKGNSNAFNAPPIEVYVVNLRLYNQFTVAMDSSYVIQYRATNVSWIEIDLTMSGWFF